MSVNWLSGIGSVLIKHKCFAFRRLLYMVGKATAICERFPGLPYVMSARWVGTEMHGKVDGW